MTDVTAINAADLQALNALRRKNSILRRLLRDPPAALAMLFIVLVVLGAIFAPLIAPCATGRSREPMAPTAMRPTPGQAYMVSVTTAPPSRKPTCRPIRVITGISALRKAWRMTTRDSGAPLARAVRT